MTTKFDDLADQELLELANAEPGDHQLILIKFLESAYDQGVYDGITHLF